MSLLLWVWGGFLFFFLFLLLGFVINLHGMYVGNVDLDLGLGVEYRCRNYHEQLYLRNLTFVGIGFV